ncbi:hypothetical protein [Serratia marcescens]|uniref:hypothetical protein n=1 Tax=Serratia marcescens TaxID=615 RepID=UPI0027E56E75|nr:hypothetical protein [Serratia marcescens]WLS21437.1 hypothetical protein RAA91_09855 [Serratia marcescens]HCB1444848.1 hypothetical protein [Serratia marcescens]HCB1482341.1 hypothetical protein [Serratia marcescens]HCB1611874.1 hypothetical protein [Serratia marcescens]HCB1617147.1 hypothetical protein [Serratia marcescens]
MKKLNLITACGLVKILFDLPEHLVLVNEILRFLQDNGLELTEDIDQFNSVFWLALFTLYDVKILNTDDESTIAFVFQNEKLGIALGNVFYSI